MGWGSDIFRPAARRHPVLVGLLEDGRLHLSGIERLAPHLTEENRDRLLARAVHRSKRQIEELVADLAPRPASPAAIRKLPAKRRDDGTSGPVVSPERGSDGVTPVPSRLRPDGAAEPGSRANGAEDPDGELRPDGVGPPKDGVRRRRPTIEPVGPARFRVRFDAGAELREKLERLQALMRSSVPDGDLATIIERAVSEKLERLEARRFAKTKRPRKTLADTDTSARSRAIPAAVRRLVEERDGGRCTYTNAQGRRCTARHDLEFHHRKPFARGGTHSPEVLCLMCPAHNRMMAEQDFGKEVMARYRRESPGRPGLRVDRVVRRTWGRSLIQPRPGTPRHAPLVRELHTPEPVPPFDLHTDHRVDWGEDEVEGQQQDEFADDVDHPARLGDVPA